MADPPDGRILARAFAQAFTKAFEQAIGGRGGQASLPHTTSSIYMVRAAAARQPTASTHIIEEIVDGQPQLLPARPAVSAGAAVAARASRGLTSQQIRDRLGHVRRPFRRRPATGAPGVCVMLGGRARRELLSGGGF